MLDEAYHSVATRAFQGQLLEALVSVEPVFLRHLLPRAMGSQLPGENVVGELDLEDLGETGAQLQIGDRHHRLDPAVQVALHDVRGAEVVIRLGAAAETKAARVLEEAADDRTHPDPLRESWDAGPQRAHAPDDELDLSAGLRRRVERVDDVGIDEVVDLDGDAAARLRLALDELGDTRPQARRRHQQLAVAMLPAVSGEEVEQLPDVVPHVRTCRAQPPLLISLTLP